MDYNQRETDLALPVAVLSLTLVQLDSPSHTGINPSFIGPPRAILLTLAIDYDADRIVIPSWSLEWCWIWLWPQLRTKNCKHCWGKAGRPGFWRGLAAAHGLPAVPRPFSRVAADHFEPQATRFLANICSALTLQSAFRWNSRYGSICLEQYSLSPRHARTRQLCHNIAHEQHPRFGQVWGVCDALRPLPHRPLWHSIQTRAKILTLVPVLAPLT